MKDKDFVSIIIPTYNRSLHYIKRAIKSIQQQTFKNHEIIISDDNLPNSNYSLQINNYCLKNNLKYLNTTGKKGANVARNRGADIAVGNYLAFLDDDDIWAKNKLELQLNYFTDDNIGMVYSNGYVVTSNSKYLYTKHKNFVKEGNLYKLFLYNYIGPTVTALIRKECFYNVGMFDETLPAKQDYDLWIRLVSKYRVVGINEPLYIYTRHISHQITDDYTSIVNGYKKIYKKYYSFIKNDFIIKFFFYFRISKVYKAQKQYLNSKKYVLKAFACINTDDLKVIF